MSIQQQLDEFRSAHPSVLRVYGELCRATVPSESWDATIYALLSVKGHLQSFPDFLSYTAWAAPGPDGDFRLHVLTQWHTFDALDIWVTEGWSAERVLRSMKPPARDIQTEILEQVT